MPTRLSRRKFTHHLLKGTGMLTVSLAALPIAPLWAHKEEEWDWYNVQDWGVEGKGWADTQRYFDRLPGKAEKTVREPVWNLSRHSAGMRTGFITDATEIHVRYKLFQERLDMPHMPATGVSGLDLYAQDGEGNTRWVSVLKPTSQEMEAPIAQKLRPGLRSYTLYLPLYNGVDSLEIGVPKGHTFEPIVPRTEKSIVFYGTSILHGACASRPGMAFPAILGRRLNRPVINLGFSGNGRMEPEVGALLSELDPCVYAIDCLPNMNAEMVSERALPLVQQLKKAHPNTPVLLVEDRSFTNTAFFPARKQHHEKSRAALKLAYLTLKEAGVEELFYLSGEKLLGLDGEGATDGSHPSDLGMMRYADAYEPVLRAMLKQYGG